MPYTPPASNAVDFELEAYSPPAANDVDFDVLGWDAASNQPTGLTVTADSTPKVTLSWSEGAPDQPGDGFKIYRAVDGGGYSLVATVPLTQTSWEDTNVSAGHKYDYQVKEYKGAEESPAATGTAYLPAAPGSCSASYVSDSQINVGWSNVSYETGYEVQRQVDGGAWVTIANKGADVTSHSDTGTSANHQYRYRVRAKGTGSYVSAWTYSGYVYTTPAAPSGCTAHYVATDKAYCTWTDNSAYEQQFRVEYRIDGGTWTFLENAAAGATQSSQVSVGANKKIEFRVRAERTSPNALQSAYSTSGAVYTTPTAPSNVVAHYQATDKAYATWIDNSAYEERFKVEYRVDGGTWTHLEYTAAGATQSSSVSVGANHMVEFRVRAERTSPDALYSSYGTSGAVYTTPAAPSNAQLSWVVPGSQLKLTITDNAAYEENIEFELEIDGVWQGAISEAANTTSKTWNVSGNHRYRARARATRSSPDALQSAWATSVGLAWAENAESVTPADGDVLGAIRQEAASVGVTAAASRAAVLGRGASLAIAPSADGSRDVVRAQLHAVALEATASRQWTLGRLADAALSVQAVGQKGVYSLRAEEVAISLGAGRDLGRAVAMAVAASEVRTRWFGRAILVDVVPEDGDVLAVSRWRPAVVAAGATGGRGNARDFAEAVSVTDAATKGLLRTKAEATAPVAIGGRELALVRLAGEALVVAEARNREFARTILASISAADGTTRSVSRLVALSTAVLEDWVRSLAANRVRSEVVSVEDGDVRYVSLREAQGIMVQVASPRDVARQQGEMVALADAGNRHVVWVRLGTEQVAPAVSPARVFGRLAPEFLVVADTWDRVWELARLVAEVGTTADKMIRSVGRLEAESVTLTDSKDKLVTVTISEGVIATTVWTRHIEWQRILEQVVPIVATAKIPGGYLWYAWDVEPFDAKVLMERLKREMRVESLGVEPGGEE